MAGENESQETVSREAHNRVTQERDDFKQLLEKANSELVRVQRREAARRWFRGDEPDPLDVAADFMLPHLSNVEPDKVGEALGSDQFKPFVSMVKQGAAPPPSSDDGGDGNDGGQKPATPPSTPGGFGGPNPAGDGAPPAEKKFKRTDPEIQELIRSNNREKLSEMYSKGLIEESRPGW